MTGISSEWNREFSNSVSSVPNSEIRRVFLKIVIYLSQDWIANINQHIDFIQLNIRDFLFCYFIKSFHASWCKRDSELATCLHCYGLCATHFVLFIFTTLLFILHITDNIYPFYIKILKFQTKVTNRNFNAVCIAKGSDWSRFYPSQRRGKVGDT